MDSYRSRKRNIRGTVREVQIQTRTLSIYLPPSYNKLSSSFPVIYVHDGGNLFHPILHELEELFSLDRAEEVILVGIEPKERLHEYTPWYSPSLSPTFPPFKGEGKAYLSFVTQTIKPYIDTSFHTKADRQNTGMIGASLGGLISLYAMYEFTDYFSKFGLLSPSLWYPNSLSYVQKNEMQMENSVFLYVGEEEGKSKVNIQRYMVENVSLVNEVFFKKLPKEQYQFILGENADHNREHFIKQFLHAIKWLYPK
jgi:predicted alpha/beta superfamily hydrolase